MQRSLQLNPDLSVEVAYRAFFLNPAIPPEGYPFAEYLQAKGGGKIPLEQFFEGPRRMGREAGLVFNFERIHRAPNSLLSHQLIQLAPAERREGVIDAIYSAYFELGLDIGDLDTLAELGGNHGLDPAETRTRLASGEGRAEVEKEARRAAQLGIGGVPFFLIDAKYGFSGAQPPEVIANILRRAAKGEA